MRTHLHAPRLRSLVFGSLVATTAALASTAHAQAIGTFTPTGSAKQVRQVTARFDTPMVAFGDPRAEAPFTVDCAPPGKGRWADTRNWVYDFDADLPAGVRCTFTPRADLRDASGAVVATHSPFRFDTGGPAILQQMPWEGDTIDERQMFILGLDAPADAATVAANAWCSVAGVNERIGVRVVDGDERRRVLDARAGFLNAYLRVLLLDPATGRTTVFGFTLPPGNDDRSRFLKLRDAPDSPLVVVACKRVLPAGAAMKLVWGAGIATASGVATTQAQALAYQVRPAFRASFSCPRANKNAQCIPILPMRLAFSAPIKRTDAAQIRLLDDAGHVLPARLDNANGDPWVDGVSFGPGLAEMTAYRIELPAALKDDAGRPLANAAQFPLRVRTDQSPPLVKFAATFGILESHAGADGPLLPVTVRNVEPNLAGRVASVATLPDKVPGRVLKVTTPRDIARWIARIDDNDRIDARYDDEKDRWIIRNDGVARSLFDKDDVTRTIGVPVAANGKAFEVVGIPLKAPGFYVVELASPRLGAALFGQPRPYYARAATLVTNLAVHFKRGGENSLVWVTHLDDATPAANADVDVLDCTGRAYWRGRTDAQGIARIDRALPDTSTLPKCNTDGRRAYFVAAQGDDDMAFAYSDWDEGIAPWRFNVPTADASTSTVAHAVMDRTLLRAGDTLGIKVFVRRQTGAGFALPGAEMLDGTLVLRHQGSDRHFDVPVAWTGARYGTASFAIPRDAPLGTYDVAIRDRLRGRDMSERSVGTFRVEEFRVPLMRARVQAVGGPFVDATSVPLDVSVAYLSGGGAGGLPVMLRTQTRSRSVDFAGYDDYTFSMGDVREGRSAHGAETADDDADDDSATASSGADSPVATTPLTLDASGGARTVAGGIAHGDRPRELVAEVEYRDPNGETSTAATRVPLWTSSLVLGIKPDGWFARKDRLKFTVAALDTSGKPVANTHVSVDAFSRETFSHRRRLIGGFYAFENGSETKRLGAFCDGNTNAQGLLICDAPAPGGGTLVMRAQAADGGGRTAVTQREFFVASGDDGWFDASDNDRIDLLPEQKQVKPGDTARLQVRTPFKDSTALVTVEREGVLDAFVVPLSRANPVIEVPIKPNYSPNVYVSALVVRGRIADVQPTALVDLGKPTFKMGLAALRVGWSAHTLDVKVATDKPVYRTRDTVTVDVDVKRADGGTLPAGADIALAAVDEGLLELLPNDSWKLLDAMMAERGLDVDTATASMQVIGRRHFGRKAVATGGGGGRSSARELFDTLLAWKPNVALDANGHARVTLPLNDSLTSFRIVAVADAGTQWFGTGAASIRTTQPLMLLPGLPQGVREGDKLRAGFTVRNASDVAQRVDVTASATTAAGNTLPALAPTPVELAPGASRTIGWDVVVPDGATSLAWRVDAKAVSGEGAAAQTFTDALKLTLPVTQVVPERTYQATLFQLDKPQNIPVEKPADALPGRGGIAVTAQNRLAGELPGVAEFLARYPFDCFEQLTSVAIGLRDRARWDALMARMPNYVDRDGLVRYWPFIVRGDDTLTSYVYSVADEAGYPLPNDMRAQLEHGLIGFVEGRIVRGSALPTADLTLRKLAALEALSRRKAPFSPRWLDTFTIEPKLWPTSAVIDWYWILKRQPALPQRDARMAEAQTILRTRLNFQGTTMNFSTERSDALWWLMVNGDVNANRLLLALVDAPAWKEDMPRLARGALGRMQKGRWSTTVANAWGVLALERFSATFEKTPVTGAVAATLGDAVRTEKFSGGTEFETHTERLPWPSARTDLGLAHVGDGAPWVTLASIAAIPLKEPLSSGYALVRTVTPVQQKTAGTWNVGDIARVRLDVDAQTDMTWVALVDPIPPGATILGRGFGTDSTLATQGERGSAAGAWPTFDQRGSRDYRAFWQYLPKGKTSVEYTVRLNNAGTFAMPGSRAEAMYAPELFGELPGSTWSVQP